MGTWLRQIVTRPISLRLDPNAWSWVLVAIGVGLRLLDYAADRPYWLDEGSLHGLIVRPWLHEAERGFENTQLAPPGFVALVRLAALMLGTGRPAMRLVPLIAGIAAVFLLRALAMRVLPVRGGLLALALFALSDEQIYFSSELKPYSTDISVAIGLWLLAVIEPRGPRWLLVMALAGALGVWLSYPSVLVLGGIGIAGLLERGSKRDLCGFLIWSMVGAFWLGNVWTVRHVSLTELDNHNAMWTFWTFAFPPSLSVDPMWMPRRVLYLFVNPLDFHGPFDPRISALPAIVCAALGVWKLARCRPRVAWVLLAPLFLALAAAVLRLYPFHGRCLLFLTPMLMMLVAAGAEMIMARAGRLVGILLVVCLLAHTVWIDAWQVFDREPRYGLNRHGDRRPEWLVPDFFDSPPRGLFREPPTRRLQSSADARQSQ